MGKASDLLISMAHLSESVNDKNILKVVFLAGGMGSGKSFIVKEIIGKKGPVSGLGAIIINSDDFTELRFKKLGLPLTFDPDDVEKYARQMKERDIAKALATSKLKNILDAMLPIVMDGTGKDFDKISSQANALREVGYDASMIFVNTTLDVAKARNQARERTVTEVDLIKSWKDVQSNLGKFQKFFGQSNFFLIDNSKNLEGAELEKIKTELFKKGKKIFEKPLKNKKGIALIKKLKETGGKMLSDAAVVPKLKV